MADPNRLIRAGDILLASDVRRLCGIAPDDRHALKRWRASRGFPEPIRAIKASRKRNATVVELWARSDVKAWLKANPPASNLIEPEETT